MQSAFHPILGPRREIHDLTGRVALVTGGALGIGYEISRAFALNGARVIMVNRKEEQGEAAIDQIKEESDQKAQIEWVECDLANLNQVKDVFTGICRSEERLDLLILSAGINANQYGETVDGYERIFQVNWLSQFYVVNLLYPLLRKTSHMADTPAPRIVFEGSEVHRATTSSTKFASRGEINDLSKDPTQLYARTKLAIILGVKYGLLDRVIRPNEDRVFALVVHPGAVRQYGYAGAMERSVPGLLGKLLTTAMTAISRSPEQGSFSALYAATSPEIEEKGWNGYYFTDPGQPGKETAQASDLGLASALWDLSHKMIRDRVGEGGIVDWDVRV